MSDGERGERPGVEPTLPADSSQPLAIGATRTGVPSEPSPVVPSEGDFPQLPTVAPSSYVFGAEVARGGMGRISLARDRRLHRPVAIKEVLPGSPELGRRFEREARITARLQHPAIVNVYEAGRWPTGEPFFAMKMVKGRSLKDVVAQTTSLSERLAVLPKVIQISEALAYAHAERIVHRDLKPSNVLVGDFGETVVIDWGLAKDLRDESPDDDLALAPVGPGLTVAGAVMGTPGYMAPEQGQGDPVDERADVFSLGAILYFVLTGEPPYHGSTQTEILTAQRTQPPTPITTRVPGVPRDLASIVEKAMSRDPAARFPSARELAEELTAFQTGQLVKAHQYSRAELLRRWIRRYRGELLVAGLALVFAGLALGEAFRRIVNERDRAEAAGHATLMRADELTLSQAREALDANPKQVFALLSHLSLDAPQWSAARLIADEARRRGIPRELAGHRAPITAMDWDPRQRRLATGDLEGHVWLWGLDGQGRELGRVSGQVNDLDFSPSGTRLALGWRDADGFRLNDAASWEITAEGAVRTELASRQVVMSNLQFRDEEHLVAATAEGVSEWSLPAGTRATLGDKVAVVLVELSRDGRWIAAMTNEARIILLDRTAGTSRALAIADPRGMVFSPSGEWLAVPRKDGAIELHRPGTGERKELLGHRDGRAALCWLDDARLASGGRDHDLRIWTIDGAEPKVVRGHAATIEAIECAEDGHLLVTASKDGTVRLWSDQGESLRVIAGFVGPPGAPRFLVPDPGWRAGHAKLGGVEGLPELAVPGSDELLRLYRLRDDARIALDGPEVEGATFSRDGKALATAHDDGSIRIYDVESQTSRIVDQKAGHQVSLALLGDRRVLSVGAYGEVVSWDPASGARTKLRGLSIGPIVVSPDERFAAAPSSRTPDVLVWDLGTGEVQALAGHTSWVRDVVWVSARRLATASQDDTVRLWDLESDRSWILPGGGGDVSLVVASADGRWIAAAGESWVRAYHLPTGRQLDLAGEHGKVTTLVFAPRGLALAAGFEGGGAVVWATPEAPARRYFARAVPTTLLVFDPEGATLITGASDGGLIQWDVATGESRELRAPSKRSPSEQVFRTSTVVWSPAGRLLVTAASDEPTLLWADDLPHEPRALRAWLARVTGP